MANLDPFTLTSRDIGRDGIARPTQIPAGKVELAAEVALPADARGLVLFAYGSGASHKSPRNQRVAQALRRKGLGTLLFDTLTPAERRQDAVEERLRFDIGLLARRLALVTDWARRQACGGLPIGYFGAGGGATAALVAAADRPKTVRAAVCHGGRPDLAGSALRRLRAPTLLIVGSEDLGILESNELSLTEMPGFTRLEVVPGAGHLCEERHALETVSRLAAAWFVEHLAPSAGLSPMR
jgi:putative phosphoribosyl transferase